MGDKSELLKEMGWNEDLIKHFMVDDMPFAEKKENELKTELYESNAMTFVYNAGVTGVCTL